MARGLPNDFAELQKTANDHLERARMLGASLDQRMKRGMREMAKHEEAWSPTDEWRADFDKVSQALTQAGNALMKAQEANEKKLGGMTAEQLEAQLKAEMLRLAEDFSAEEWATLDAIRMKQFLKRGR